MTCRHVINSLTSPETCNMALPAAETNIDVNDNQNGRKKITVIEQFKQ